MVALTRLQAVALPALALLSSAQNKLDFWACKPRGALDEGEAIVDIDASKVLVEAWEGFGTSLVWWAQTHGSGEKEDEIADVLFTLKWTNLTTDKGTYHIPGLGMTIARFNAGASSWNTIGPKDSAIKMKESWSIK